MRENFGEFTSEREAQENEDRTDHNHETQTKEQAQNMLAANTESRKLGRLKFMPRLIQGSAENFQVGLKPEENLATRLPEQMKSREDHENADERQRAVYLHAPRFAARESRSRNRLSA